MRIAICDDDEWELFQLQKLLKEYQLSREISADCRFFHNSTDFLCEIEGGEYDVILLDVLMPGINGVQAARELREMDKNVKIIFVSSSPEFALESYSVGAYYYLIKPIDANALFPLLDKAVSELMIQQEQGFVLKNRKCVVKVPFQRLAYVEVINKTVSFHLADGTVHEITAALADFEEKLLSRPEFFKTHRSYLVNLGHVEAIRGNCVMTKNGESIPISRQRRSLVQDAYVRFPIRQKLWQWMNPRHYRRINQKMPMVPGGFCWWMMTMATVPFGQGFCAIMAVSYSLPGMGGRHFRWRKRYPMIACCWM